MGCHTWLYKRVSSVTDKEKKILIQKQIDRIKKYWIMSTTLNEWLTEAKDSPCKDCATEEYYNTTRTQYNNSIKKMQEGNYDEALRYAHLYSFNDVMYIECELWGDNLFRVYGYPEETFNDAKSLIKFLYKYNQDLIGYYKENDDSQTMIKGMCKEIECRIYKFFNDNPNGLISFG